MQHIEHLVGWQQFPIGWTTEVVKGNKVAIGDSNSPVLNATNSSSDRATVMGICLMRTAMADGTKSC